MKIEAIEHSHPDIYKARTESNRVLLRLRDNMEATPGISVVANGSLARGELTSQSDFDAYPLYKAGKRAAALKLFERVKSNAGLKEFASEGAFGSALPAVTVAKNIGGQKDGNRRFTLRMLLLLESASIGSREVYDRTIDSVVLRYINDDITDKQIGRFLLNDIIRFYRQMCVDFEFKTVEQTKPWGIRYAKLVFSRKLIYYSGIIMCAEMASKPASDKRKYLISMINMPPIDRLLATFGDDILDALREYNYFLSLLDDPGSRKDLAKVQMLRDSHTSLFKEVKERGHRYSRALVDILRARYPIDHPIREALIV